MNADGALVVDEVGNSAVAMKPAVAGVAEGIDAAPEQAGQKDAPSVEAAPECVEEPEVEQDSEMEVDADEEDEEDVGPAMDPQTAAVAAEEQAAIATEEQAAIATEEQAATVSTEEHLATIGARASDAFGAAFRRSSHASDAFGAAFRRSSRPSVPVVWQPPAVDEVVSVEVEDAFTQGAPEWRVARVICHEMRGGEPRFLVCVHKPSGEPDPDFLEWYDEQTERREWCRLLDASLYATLPRLDTSVPPGWSKEVRVGPKSQNAVYRGPNGETAHTRLEAWRKHTEPAAADASASDESSDAGGAPAAARSKKAKELPPGWTREARERGVNGGEHKGVYYLFWGPNGERAHSMTTAWCKHDEQAAADQAETAEAAEMPAAPDGRKKTLPPGWTKEARETYSVYWGPNGERAATIVAAWAKHAEQAAGEEEEEAADVPSVRVMGAPAADDMPSTTSDELPPGWWKRKHTTRNGNSWTDYLSADGQSAKSYADAWAKHASNGVGSGARAPAGRVKRLAESTPMHHELAPPKQPRKHSAATPAAAATPSTALALVPSSAEGMPEVAQMLERFKLANYVEVFDDQGYDDLEFMLRMRPEQVEQLIADVGMKPGHAAKFKLYLETERQQAAAMA